MANWNWNNWNTLRFVNSCVCVISLYEASVLSLLWPPLAARYLRYPFARGESPMSISARISPTRRGAYL